MRRKPRRPPELSEAQAKRVYAKARMACLASPRPSAFEVPIRKRGGRTVYVRFTTLEWTMPNGSTYTFPWPDDLTTVLADVAMERGPTAER